MHTWSALDALRAAPGRWGNDPVFFYGFDELDRARARRGRDPLGWWGTDVTVSLNYEPGRDGVRRPARRHVEELRPLAQRRAGVARHSTSITQPGSRDALHHLERWLFEAGQPGAGGSRRRRSGCSRPVGSVRGRARRRRRSSSCSAPGSPPRRSSSFSRDAGSTRRRCSNAFFGPVRDSRRARERRVPVRGIRRSGGGWWRWPRCAWLRRPPPVEALLSYLHYARGGRPPTPRSLDGLELVRPAQRGLVERPPEEARGKPSGMDSSRRSTRLGGPGALSDAA